MATGGNGAPRAGAAALAMLPAYRRRARLTQEELADRSGLSVRTIRELEAGRVRRPRKQSLRLLADALRLSGQERAALTGADGAGPAGQPLLPATPVCQLPMDVAGFTGRTDGLAVLDGLLAAAGDGQATAVVISAIAGTAGVGKTALAVHWAHRVRERFPDGQLFVNLHGYAPGPATSPLQALVQLLRGLGVEADQIPVEVEQAAGLYRSLLASRRMLVVLDNARDAEQVRPLLPGGPACLVVVTSRDRLAGLVASHGARRLTLDVLTPAEAGGLLAQILGARRVAAEPEAAGELAEVCGMLPLALRVAAANLADQPGQTIDGYVARLRRGDRLAELAVDGDPQAAVRAAFDCSYRAMDSGDQRLFRLLGLVPGPELSAPAAAALAGGTPAAAGLALERLAGSHLLEPRTDGRFGFHDLLRRYARQQADGEPDSRAALQQLLGWYLHTTVAADRLLYPDKLRLPVPAAADGLPVTRFDEPAEALAWLDAERANLVAAVQHAAEHGPAPLAWLLADALRGYLLLRRHTVDWLAVAHAAVAAAAGEGDLRAQAAALLSLGTAHWSLGRYPQAVEHLTSALDPAGRVGWVDGQAAIQSNLGIAHWELGSLQQAADHYRRALALYRQNGRTPGQAMTLVNLGNLQRELGRLAEAADHDTQALLLHRQIGSRDGEAHALNNLGEVDHDLGRLGQAHEHLTTALALHREVGNRYGEAYALQALAAVHRDAGRHRQAHETGRAALRLALQVGDRRAEAETLNTLGGIHQRLGRHRQAADHHQRALDLARESNARYPETEALLGLAAAHRHAGRHAEALQRAEQAVAVARRGGYLVLEGQAHAALAAAHLDAGDLDRAAAHGRQALEVQRQTGHRLGQARTLVTLGEVLARTGGADAAAACRQEARSLFSDIGCPEPERLGS
jgi:tetratricopeptide (TPR) repeat protein